MKTLFESDYIKVYMNPSGDVFHLNKSTSVILRITENSSFTRISTNGNHAWIPQTFNDNPAMAIKPINK